MFAITRFLYIELFSICCIFSGVKKIVRYRQACFIEVPLYVYTGPSVLPHGSEDHILLIHNLDLGSFAFGQKPPRLHTFSNIIGSLSIDDGNGSENVSFKMNSRFFNPLWRLFQFAENGKGRRISLELIS